MAKFKVIEKSRFLDDEMKEIKGGVYTALCKDGRTHYDCNSVWYVSCGPSVTGQYASGLCPNGAIGYEFCGGSGYTFQVCAIPMGKGTPCSGGNIYIN